MIAMTQLSDRALLERALIAIEEALSRVDGSPDVRRPPVTAAQQALTICLTAAASLVDVSQTLLRPTHNDAPAALAGEWRILLRNVKTASRAAHQAALILSAERDLAAAQRGSVVLDAAKAHHAAH